MEQPPLYNDTFSEFDITPYSSSLAQLQNLPSPAHDDPSLDTGNTPYPTNDDLVPPPYEAEPVLDNKSKFNSNDFMSSLMDQQTPSPASPPPRSQSQLAQYPQPAVTPRVEQVPQRPTSIPTTSQQFPTFPAQTVQSPVQQLQASHSQQMQTSQIHAQQIQQSHQNNQAQQQAQQIQQQLQQQQLAQQQAQQQAQQLAQQQLAQQQAQQLQQQQLAAQQLQQQQLAQQRAMQNIQQAQLQQQQLAQQQAQQQQAQQQMQQSIHNQTNMGSTPQPYGMVQSPPVQQLQVQQPSTPKQFEQPQNFGYPQLQTGPQVASVYSSSQPLPQVQSVQSLYMNPNQQSKDALNQIQNYFDKISGFMERLDRRMIALENTAQTILKNQEGGSLRSDVSSLKKMHTQVESDFDIAKRLQDELNVKYEKEKRKEAKKKAKSSSSSGTRSSSSSLATSTPKPSSSTSNSSVQECPICAVKVPIADLEVHVNMCLEGGEKPSAVGDNKTPENGEKPSIWKRVFGPGPKKEETPAPVSNAIVPANRMPPPPMRTVSTPAIYGQEYYPQQQQQYMYRPYNQPVPPQVYGYPGQQPIYYYNPNMPQKR